MEVADLTTKAQEVEVVKEDVIKKQVVAEEAKLQSMTEKADVEKGRLILKPR